MPELIALPLTRYNSARPDASPEWTAVPDAPLSDEERNLLLAKGPYNVLAAFTPSKGSSGALTQWLHDGVLTRESAGLWLMATTFTMGGRKLARLALLGGLDLAAVRPGPEGIHLIENTAPGDVRVELEFLRANQGLAGMIAATTDGLGPRLQALADELASGEPSVCLDQGDGVTHRVWRVHESDARPLAEMLRHAPMTVLHGSARLEAALAYRAERGAGLPGNRRPWDYALFCLLEAASDSLVLLPGHRLVTWYRKIDWEQALERCEPLFEAVPLDALKAVQGSRMRGAFLLALKGGTWLIQPLKSAWDELSRATPGDCAAHMFTALFVQRVLGLDLEDATDHIDTATDPEQALKLVAHGHIQAALLMRPMDVQTLSRAATVGILLPPSSNLLWPGLPAGFMFYAFGS